MYEQTRPGRTSDARGRSARRPRVDRRARACGVSTCLDTALSGAHRGPEGIAALRRQIDELTAGTWRPLRDDSFDIAMSPWHGVIMDRFLAERRERRLDSHEAVILAVEEGRITRLFHYLHDPAAFVAGGWRALDDTGPDGLRFGYLIVFKARLFGWGC
jgi:hypothetical protein